MGPIRRETRRLRREATAASNAGGAAVRCGGAEAARRCGDGADLEEVDVVERLEDDGRLLEEDLRVGRLAHELLGAGDEQLLRLGLRAAGGAVVVGKRVWGGLEWSDACQGCGERRRNRAMPTLSGTALKSLASSLACDCSCMTAFSSR